MIRLGTPPYRVSSLVEGHVPTHPSLEADPNPILTQTLNLTQGRVGAWLTTVHGPNPFSKNYFSQVQKVHSPNFFQEMYKWGSENWQYNQLHLSKLWKFFILCGNISAEAAGEIRTWPLLKVNGLRWLRVLDHLIFESAAGSYDMSYLLDCRFIFVSATTSFLLPALRSRATSSALWTGHSVRLCTYVPGGSNRPATVQAQV